MKEPLENKQNIEQLNESANSNLLDSLDIRKTANRLSDLVSPYITEMIESATNIKNSVEIGLKELKATEELLNNYRQNSEELSPLKTIEEIGKSTGCCTKILQFYNFSRKEVNEISKTFWNKEFKTIKNKWFIDNKNKYKKGIGWDEKESFIKEIQIINGRHIATIRQECKKSLKSVFKLIQEFLSDEKINYCSKLLNAEQEDIYIKKLELLLEAINPSTSPSWLTEFDKFSNKTYLQSNSISNQMLDPIYNCIWGDLAWELVDKTQSKYMKELEKTINDFFENKKKVINIFFELIMQIYNDILEKQEFYQKETQEELQARQQWFDIQQAKLLAIQALLDDALSFKA